MTCSHKNHFWWKNSNYWSTFSDCTPSLQLLLRRTDVGLSELTYHVLRRIIMQQSLLEIQHLKIYRLDLDDSINALDLFQGPLEVSSSNPGRYNQIYYSAANSR